LEVYLPPKNDSQQESSKSGIFPQVNFGKKPRVEIGTLSLGGDQKVRKNVKMARTIR
jgi:hypothetical protein